MIKLLSPSIVRKIWGGQKLEKMKGLTSSPGEGPIGETLEIYGDDLSFLAKFIDTSEELSIQVHPGDDYARRHENSCGKTECWIILEAGPDAGIFLGLKKGVDKARLKKAIEEKEAINELVNFYPVKRGDFFYVPAGSIHAIGRNITLAEVQQNSGITYRVWDWNRLDEKGASRPLHVDKSMDVINFDSESNTEKYFKLSHNIFDKEGVSELCRHPEFQLLLINFKKNIEQEIVLPNYSRPSALLNLEMPVTVNNSEIKSFNAVVMEAENKLTIRAAQDGACLLIL